eukprot:m.34384 g.34384  ORF g.34384 m.34384 type:complete len:758 (-) comp11011_c1_seq1:272-2545(-)
MGGSQQQQRRPKGNRKREPKQRDVEVGSPTDIEEHIHVDQACNIAQLQMDDPLGHHQPDAQTMAKVARVRKEIIGHTCALKGPFGRKPIIYADYTASGRSVAFIEDFIRNVVLPTYANTHTEASATGLQTTEFREEARDIIREACGGTPDEHVVLFTGSGSTAAIAEMIGVLSIAVPHDVLQKYELSQSIPDENRPVVFIGPYEHHSNEVSWRETLATVVTIPETPEGRINTKVLEEMLRRYKNRPVKVGSFSAGSNVTGVLTDVPNLATILHRHGALAFFDYAAAAPYVEIDMQLRQHASRHAYLDAVFISPHKFVGGPGTPGLLVARRELFHNAAPVHPGGGTVEFVSPTRHKYRSDIQAREEGGTPDIVGSIRCGLVFKLKQDIGVKNIHALEMNALRAALQVWCPNKNIVLLGKQTLPKLTITSFVIRVESKFLHHNFVVAVLNDLFGIQSRGGCSCAGPYGHRLLHVKEHESEAFAEEVAKGFEGIKPGWTRLNFPYFLDEYARDYIIQAVDMIANHGWKLLPDYVFDVKTGLWQHRSIAGTHPPRKRLADLKLVSEATCGTVAKEASVVFPPKLPFEELNRATYARLLQEARETFENAWRKDRTNDPPQKVILSKSVENLRWFALPTDFVGENRRSVSISSASPVSSASEDLEQPTTPPLLRKWQDESQDSGTECDSEPVCYNQSCAYMCLRVVKQQAKKGSRGSLAHAVLKAAARAVQAHNLEPALCFPLLGACSAILMYQNVSASISDE